MNLAGLGDKNGVTVYIEFLPDSAKRIGSDTARMSILGALMAPSSISDGDDSETRAMTGC